ncbi:vWA domain-containing protein [Nakamurella deserti]|uniref:vWA domain-containing protein n=1 Tax=Nakamurella deserti TaxID=2164074 RepID=UPI001F0C63C9|nr:VWA domain-containing protein [Nakamurella deserti]
MPDLTRGANAPLTSTGLDISVAGARQGTVDLMVFQLGADRKVRSDDDFVFFNQPASPEGAVRLAAGDRVTVDLTRVPAAIETLAVAVALDDAVTGSLATIDGLAVTVTGGSDEQRAAAAGFTTERAAVLVEVYRRAGAWKLRNISAGWAQGLAALAREHGVSVDDAPAPAPAPQAAPTPPPPPPAAPVPDDPWRTAGSLPTSTSVVPPAPGQWPTPAPDPLSPPPYQAPVGGGGAGGGPAPTPVTASPAAVPADAAGPRSVPGEQRLSMEKRQKLDLRKREVHKVLLTKGAAQERARIVLVLDKTGSMYDEYQAGIVHRVVERMVPVATQLDDDGSLECYLYAVDFAKLPDLRVEDLERWMAEFIHIDGVHGGIDYRRIGGYNDEIPIMDEIIGSLAGQTLPTLVLFFTDGGFSKKREITKLMQRASNLPAFWQFVGIGRNNFGVLTKLDEMTGRVVDNVGFFAVTDIDRIDDAELYRRLLSEFPDWLRAARSAGVLR